MEINGKARWVIGILAACLCTAAGAFITHISTVGDLKADVKEHAASYGHKGVAANEEKLKELAIEGDMHSSKISELRERIAASEARFEEILRRLESIDRKIN